MKSMYIGSGDTSAILAGKKTLAYKKILQRFVSDEKPHYNAKASPIDALRTGAILEERYHLYLEVDFYPQCYVICDEFDVLKSTLDFAKYNDNKVIEFQELKTCQFNDFLKLQNADINYIKKNYKNNYNQVQQQLLCTGLDSATLVFLVVYEYIDEVNYSRDILDDEVIKFEIKRDEDVISKIIERASFFQTIKDLYNENLR